MPWNRLKQWQGCFNLDWTFNLKLMVDYNYLLLTIFCSIIVIFMLHKYSTDRINLSSSVFFLLIILGFLSHNLYGFYVESNQDTSLLIDYMLFHKVTNNPYDRYFLSIMYFGMTVGIYSIFLSVLKSNNRQSAKQKI